MLAKTGEKVSCVSVDPDTLAHFLQNGIQGPSRPIQIDWSVGLTAHSWNTEAISLLAQICLHELSQDPLTLEAFNKITLELDHRRVQRCIKTKLDKPGRDSRRGAAIGALALQRYQDSVKTQDRRTTRRNTVRKLLHFIMTYS